VRPPAAGADTAGASAPVRARNAPATPPTACRGDHRGPLLDRAAGFDVIACAVCDFTHVVPLPTPAELARTYRHEYYTAEKPLYLERHREDLAWWNLVYAERYDTFEALLPAGRRRILDVGSGPGFFLCHGRERGWQGVGIEPSAQAAAHARTLGLEIVEDFLTADTAARLGSFDVVHLSEVLEHIPDPGAMLRLVHGLLAPDGVACVVVPNDYSPFQQALRAAAGYAPWWLAPPHHLNYFGFDSLARLLVRSGFAVCLREATFPIDLFLLMGDDYVGDDDLGRQCHRKRMRFEERLERAGLGQLRRDLYRALAAHGVGREAVLVGRAAGRP
jgi:SAM-dependent methyltransferase